MATGKLNIEEPKRILSISEHVKALVATAPPLTVEQCAVIRAQLGPIPHTTHQAVAA